MKCTRLSAAVSVLVMLVAPADLAGARLTPIAKCGIAKVRAATKKVQAKMNCHLRAVRKDVPVDSECLQKAEDKFNAAVAKAEGKGGCATTGEATAIESAVDDCVASIRNPFLCRPSGMSCLSGSECCSGLCPAAVVCESE